MSALADHRARIEALESRADQSDHEHRATSARLTEGSVLFERLTVTLDSLAIDVRRLVDQRSTPWQTIVSGCLSGLGWSLGAALVALIPFALWCAVAYAQATSPVRVSAPAPAHAVTQ